MDVVKTMDVQIDPSRLRRLKWHEYAVRFAFAGWWPSPGA